MITEIRQQQAAPASIGGIGNGNEAMHGDSKSCLTDAVDSIKCALLKAQALITMAHGEAGGEFRNMNGDYQDRFLWAISDLIDEATHTVQEIEILGSAT